MVKKNKNTIIKIKIDQEYKNDYIKISFRVSNLRDRNIIYIDKHLTDLDIKNRFNNSLNDLITLYKLDRKYIIININNNKFLLFLNENDNLKIKSF